MYSSVATGSDGMGLISYYDETLSALKVAHCSDVACTSATITTLDGAGGANVGMFSSVAVGMFSSNVAIGSDGMGLISYYDSDDKDLKIAHCSDVACTSATITTLDGAGGANVGMFSSVATGSDGIVVISYLDSDSNTQKIIGVSAPRQIGIAYYDVANNSLKFANGSSTWNAAVTDWAAQTVSATGSNNGQYTNVVYDESASRVHVSYFSTSSVGTLNHVTGTWDNISQEYQWSSPAVIVDGSPTLKYSTLTLDSDGRPHVVFRQGGKIKHAWGLWSAATNSWSWPTMFVEEIQSGVGNNGGVDMVTGAANSLHISFYDGYNSSDITPVTLKYASASYNSASDSWAWQVESVDGSSSLDVGEYSAITIDESGAVFIAYYDATNGNLKIAHN
jgi:preprotein translocase subunit Sec61beta